MARRKRDHSKALVVLLVAILAFWWGISVLLQQGGSAISTASASFSVDNYAYSAPLTVTHALKKNVDSYSGSITLPACDTLGTGISTTGSAPAHVTLLITVLKLPSCAAPQGAAAVAQPFSIAVSRYGGASPVFDGVTVNGVIIPSHVIEAAS